MTAFLSWPHLKSLLIGRSLLAAVDRNKQAADKLDAALREVLEK